MAIMWYIALSFVLVASAGLVFLKNALSYLRGDFRKGMGFLLIAASLAVLSSLLTALFAIFQVPISSMYWNAIPAMFSLATFFFVLNTRRLEKLFKVAIMEVEGNRKRVDPVE